jgi:hypothetical protein
VVNVHNTRFTGLETSTSRERLAIPDGRCASSQRLLRRLRPLAEGRT